MGREVWLRTTRHRPCPICSRPKWCSIAADGGAVICMRTESRTPTRNGGWLHRLSDRPTNCRPPQRVQAVRAAPSESWHVIAAEAQRRTSDAWLTEYAATLGFPSPVGPDALRQLGAGRWAGYGTEWLAIPMHDCEGNVVGIRLRHHDGRKLAIRGSNEGLILGLTVSDTLLVVEGPTDAAASICAWPDASVVGRPSCRGAEMDLVELVRAGNYGTVVLLADQDTAGLTGATHAAESVALVHQHVRLVDRLPAKDVRELVRKVGAAAAGAVLKQLVNSASPIAIEITWREARA